MTEFEMLLACYRSGQISERQWQGHLKDREFREWVEARTALSHPTPDGCGREGKHQWGGLERNREVCVNCGATRVLEGGSAGVPVAWWVHDLHVARQPVKARARYPEPTEFLYPASREQDARNAAKMLGGKCTPLFAHPTPLAGGDDG